MAKTNAELEQELDSLKAKFQLQHPDAACPELTCDEFDSVTIGKSILVTDKDSNCPKRLAAKSLRSIPVDANGEVENHTGEGSDPLILEGLQGKQGGFKRIVIQATDGTLAHWIPKNDGNVYKLVTTGDTIEERIDEFVNEFDVNLIDEVACCADMTFIIGGALTSGGKMKLVKMTREKLLECFCDACGGIYDPLYDLA